MSNQHKAVPANEATLVELFKSDKDKLNTVQAVKHLAELKTSGIEIKSHVMNNAMDSFILAHEKAEKKFDQVVQIFDALLPARWFDGHNSEALTENERERVVEVRKAFLAKSKARGHKNEYAQWSHLLKTAKKKHDGKASTSGSQKHFDTRIPDDVKKLLDSHKRANEGTQDLTSAKSKAFVKELGELRDKHYPK